MAVLRPHLALTVTEVERSIPCYEALLGAAPAQLRDDYAKFEVADPALNPERAGWHNLPNGMRVQTRQYTLAPNLPKDEIA